MSNLETILATLRYDPLGAAEDMTGQSYKTDAGTEALGFINHIAHTQRKQEMLKMVGDTHFGMSSTDMLSKLLKDGFDLLLVDSFKDVPYRNEDRPPYDERAYLLYCRRRGILVWMETYARGGTIYGPDGGVNTVKFIFNWRPKSPDSHLEGYSGHCVIDPTPLYTREKTEHNPEGHVYAIAGYIDGREGMFSRLQWMEQNGQFITPWLERPWLWLLTYMDTKDPQTGESLGLKGYDHEAITNARLARLPAEVVVALGPKKE